MLSPAVIEKLHNTSYCLEIILCIEATGRWPWSHVLYILCLHKHLWHNLGQLFPLSGQNGRQRRYILDLSVCLSVHSSVTRLVNTIFWKCIKRFWCQLAQVVMGQGHESVHFGISDTAACEFHIVIADRAC